MGSSTGFIGLGAMGEPMALNLLRSGQSLVVWNRTVDKTGALAAAGATVAKDPGEVFGQCPVVILMLANGDAIDAVLARGTARFADLVKDRVVVHMGTTSPDYSTGLERDIVAAGGRYVEAPVSGSRKPAEEGKLVAMLAGDAATIDRIVPLIAPIAATTLNCGAAPKATLMKLAVNTFLVGMLTALAESTNFAKRSGLDMDRFRDVLLAGPMASDVMRVKLPKLIARDFATQAAIVNVVDSNRLIREAAGSIGAAVPLVEVCERLYERTVALGQGAADMVAVLDAIEAENPE